MALDRRKRTSLSRAVMSAFVRHAGEALLKGCLNDGRRLRGSAERFPLGMSGKAFGGTDCRGRLVRAAWSKSSRPRPIPLVTGLVTRCDHHRLDPSRRAELQILVI